MTQKIVRAACRVADGVRDKLALGNIEIERDWGWAEEYVDAMWRILQQEKPEDYIIATGTSCKLREFVAAVFETLNLNWEEHVIHNEALLRPSDIMQSRAQPAKAEKLLNWKAETTYQDVARKLVSTELNRLRKE